MRSADLRAPRHYNLALYGFIIHYTHTQANLRDCDLRFSTTGQRVKNGLDRSPHRLSSLELCGSKTFACIQVAVATVPGLAGAVATAPSVRSVVPHS